MSGLLIEFQYFMNHIHKLGLLELSPSLTHNIKQLDYGFCIELSPKWNPRKWYKTYEISAIRSLHEKIKSEKKSIGKETRDRA